MIATIVIAAITCIGMMAAILFKPTITIKGHSVGTYWMITCVGALIMLIANLVPFDVAMKSLIAQSAINPIKILVIFISLALISIYLDEIGFFKYIANEALKRSKESQFRLFFILYAVVSILTIFTSNDIIILTFTPFICFFCKNAKINPIPYLVSEFIAANTWSMFLEIGNPTNIYLATSESIGFIEYIKVMWLPTLLAGLTSFSVLVLLFYKSLKAKIENPIIEDVNIKDMGALIIGIVHLGICIIGLAISSYIHVEMYLIALGSAISLFICATIYNLVKKNELENEVQTLKRAPYELIPFVLSMFIIVEALSYQGVTDKMFELLNVGHSNIVYGISSAIAANFLNNIPMSVLYSAILADGTTNSAIFSAIVGSNIGAFLTPIGALAGIMWANTLKKNDIRFNYLDFIKYGVLDGVPTLLVALLLL